MALLECRGLRYSYGSHEALRGVDLALDPGRILGIIGPNGAGKSTLLRLAAGLARPTSGEVLLGGSPTTGLKPRELGRTVGYVPQAFDLPFSFSVLDVVLQGRHPHMAGRTFETKEDLAVARHAMERTGVWELRDRDFGALSGGERQRAVIAAALCQEPRLLVLDEPTSSLDLKFQGTTVALLRELAGSRELAVLVALHDLSLAGALCDSLLLLVAGEVDAEGGPEEVLDREVLERAYETRLHVGRGPQGPYVLPLG